MSDFLNVNEVAIRKIFNRFKEYWWYKQDAAIAHREEPIRTTIRTKIRIVIDKLDQYSQIDDLRADEVFCQNLVGSLFPEDIVELFGGYRNFLSLPTFANNEFTQYRESDYVRLPIECMPVGCNVVIGLLPSSRPIIGLRMRNEKQGNDFIKCYHSRESNDTACNWVRGEDESCSFAGTTMRDLPIYGNQACIGEFHYLRGFVTTGEYTGYNGYSCYYGVEQKHRAAALEEMQTLAVVNAEPVNVPVIFSRVSEVHPLVYDANHVAQLEPVLPEEQLLVNTANSEVQLASVLPKKSWKCIIS